MMTKQTNDTARIPDIPSVLRRVFPVGPFKTSDISDFTPVCRHSVVYGRYVRMFTSIDNSMTWKRVLTGNSFTVICHQGVARRCFQPVEFHNVESLRQESCELSFLVKSPGCYAEGILHEFGCSIQLHPDARW